MQKNTKTLSAIAALLVTSTVVSAHSVALPGDIEIPAGSNSYVNAGGKAIRTGLGECLKLGGFSEDTQVNACEGIDDEAELAAKAEAEAEEAARAAAEAEEAAKAAAEAAPAPEPVTKAPIVTTATLGGSALFGTNSSDLTPASEQALSELVAELETYQEISAIEVVGHSDSTGQAEYNQQLSERRAAAVEQFLAAAYPSATVTSSGLGEASPIATNSTSEGRSANRRVEVQVTAKGVVE